VATTTVPEVSFLRLGDLASNKGAIVSGPFGSNIGTKFFRDSGVPLIRGNNLSIGCLPYFKEEGFVFITEEKAEELRNCTSIKGDIILTAAGTLGQTGIITEENIHPKYIISNKQIRVRVDPNLSDSLFVYYWLSSPQMKWVVESYNSGSTVPLINLGSVRRFPIPNFPLTTQKKISEILSTIDSKLLLGNKISSTLQSLISLLFRSWFIDFDPVKAKAEGKFPYGMDEETAALFPDSFVDSNFGSIPHGWSLETLGSMATNQAESFDFSNKSEVIFINTGDVLNGELLHSDFISTDGLPGQAKKAVNNGDILYSEIRPKNKRFAYLESEIVSEIVVSTKFMVLRAKNPCYQKFIYQHITLESSINFFNHMAESRSGTFPQVTFDSIKRCEIVVPPEEVLEKFEELVKPYFDLINETKAIKVSLSSCRNVLLLRLMSGELSVS
jgi:type I restriction enzyme, S subunit